MADLTPAVSRPTMPSLPASVQPLMTGRPDRSRFSDDGEYLGTVEDWRPPATLPVAVLEDCRAALAVYERALVPMEPHALSGRVASMLKHYFQPAVASNAEHAVQLQRMVAHDWHEALGEFPDWAVQEACRRWIKREEKRPTPAGIRAECQRLCAEQLKTRDRLRMIVEASAPSRERPANVVQLPNLRRVQDAGRE